MISSLSTESEYRISKHSELKPGENHRADPAAKPIRKWTALAYPPDDFNSFDEKLQSDHAVGRKNTVFTENIVSQYRSKSEIMALLSEHVQHNMVKIGKKFYRQKEGIPQGSVVSSLLCNYFYADLEAKHLSFLTNGESLLLRLIDDFLLITTNRAHAKQFLQVMHDGLSEYGVRVNPEKTLVNFEVAINGRKVKSLCGETAFPYCGSFIDVKTLDISRDRERRKDMGESLLSLQDAMVGKWLTCGIAVIDSLTVEFSRVPGKAFQKKVLSELHSLHISYHVRCSSRLVITVVKSCEQRTTSFCSGRLGACHASPQRGSLLLIPI